MLAEQSFKAAADVDGRLTHAFRRVLGRMPTDRDMQTLRRAYARQTAIYKPDSDAAKALLSVGASKRDESLNLTEHAALEFSDEIRVLLSDDGLEYHLAAARHKRGLDDLSADAYSLPEEKIAWVHNFRLPVKQKARHVAVQVLHKKQYIVSDELAVVKGTDSLPAFQPKPDTRVALVTDGVAFMPVWGNVQPICLNLPLRSRLEKQDARSGDKFDKPCKILLDLPETLKFASAGITPTEVKHDGRTFRRYTINWAGEGP